ncbi:uncharacterized protein LOC129593153 isoform X2 [Paramacrobiotus metropolitanus]|uniref:uncharacterized protein LOC129593153 isoform X2 n=1 Tax=Paramacrobiotus metropolitanus TaxID=2943436 RepID=UPI0024456D95|nr:uncharacterized protein LOC129593153 isoform X2 [Paramacrobiotus metropolitanus]
MKHTYGWNKLFSRKTVAAIFMRHEIECDIREQKINFEFEEQRSVLQYLEKRMDEIFTSTYKHRCSDECVAKQCGKLFIMDGLWKIVFRHCIAEVQNIVKGISLINFPQVCMHSPCGNSLFCLKHRIFEEEEEEENGKESDRITIHMAGVSRALQTKAKMSIDSILSGEVNAGSEDITCRKFDPNLGCRKDKGENQRGHLYSRGYLFLVGPTGHIFSFAPIYRAESLGQVYLFIVGALYELLQDVAPEEWEKVFICYDNICQLNRLKAAAEPLPFPEPFDQLWSRVSKIVDGLHIQNHKDSKCKEKYHPSLYLKSHPTATERNTMAAEQTFSWLAKYKKQLNAMNKSRQFFFIHRMAVRRNDYLSDCLADNSRPVGGTMRTFKEK